MPLASNHIKFNLIKFLKQKVMSEKQQRDFDWMIHFLQLINSFSAAYLRFVGYLKSENILRM